MSHDIALGLVSAGCAVTMLAAIGAVVVGDDVFARLHFLTPVTSIAFPLVAAGLCVESGQPWVMAEVLLITVMAFLLGPVLESAVARVVAGQREVIDAEQPQ